MGSGDDGVECVRDLLHHVPNGFPHLSRDHVGFRVGNHHGIGLVDDGEGFLFDLIHDFQCCLC
jgi:hypothetical protein